MAEPSHAPEWRWSAFSEIKVNSRHPVMAVVLSSRNMNYEYVDKPLAYPSRYIVPLIGQPNGPFLGTAFFCGNGRTLLTARHCVEGWDGDFSFGDMSDRIVTPKKTHLVAKSDTLDVAMLQAIDHESEYFLILEDPKEIRHNLHVFSYEYGTTLSAGKRVEFNPATRMGNVTRTVNLESQFGKTGNAMLELSFPALKGASGSPVMGPGQRVWGMIVANHTVEFLPTQIEEVRNSDGILEERIAFSMPQALAMNTKHLSEFLQSCKTKEPSDAPKSPVSREFES